VTRKSPQGPESLAYHEQNHGRSSPNPAALLPKLGTAQEIPLRLIDRARSVQVA